MIKSVTLSIAVSFFMMMKTDCSNRTNCYTQNSYKSCQNRRNRYTSIQSSGAKIQSSSTNAQFSGNTNSVTSRGCTCV